MSRAPRVPAGVQAKADAVAATLERSGARLADVRARKLRWDSSGASYSVELGRRYRLIVRKVEGGFEVGPPMSHEDHRYNRTKPR